MATVGLLGIPITCPRYFGSQSPPQVCNPGATDAPRKELERLILQASSGIVPEIRVVDLGELLAPQIIPKRYYADLGLKANEVVTSSGADIVLVIGGDHSVALPFYHVHGSVVRADAHGDAYAFDGQPLSGTILDGGTYMVFVEKQGLKSPSQVLNVGVRKDMLDNRYHHGGFVGSLVDVPQILNNSTPSDVSFLDIDLDVLAVTYGLPHMFHTSDLAVEDLANLITKLKPHVVGLFECVQSDGTIPPYIVSRFKNVFAPICEAVAKVAIARSVANQQTHLASSATCR